MNTEEAFRGGKSGGKLHLFSPGMSRQLPQHRLKKKRDTSEIFTKTRSHNVRFLSVLSCSTAPPIECFRNEHGVKLLLQMSRNKH